MVENRDQKNSKYEHFMQCYMLFELFNTLLAIQVC